MMGSWWRKLWRWSWVGIKAGETPNVVAVRVEVEGKPEWTPGDAAALAQFLNGPAGRKLERLLHWSVCAGAVSAVELDGFAQGVRYGRALCVGEVFTLARVEHAGGSAAVPQ